MCFQKKAILLCRQSEQHIATVEWCNGSTRDSGPLCLGSSPSSTTNWRLGRVVDGGSLENCCTATYRGFESLSLRREILKRPTQKGRFLYLYSVMISCRNAPPEFRFASSTLRNFVPSGAVHEAAVRHALSEHSVNYPATFINVFSTTIIML